MTSSLRTKRASSLKAPRLTFARKIAATFGFSLGKFEILQIVAELIFLGDRQFAMALRLSCFDCQVKYKNLTLGNRPGPFWNEWA
jgi:hypothetical protein